MTVFQAILIALFVYLGAIGSIVGNTIGWYTLGRPLIAAFVVGLILGNVPLAIELGLLLQLAYLGSVTPGGAMAWDLSYATYIGVAGTLVFAQDLETAQSFIWVFAGIGGAIGVAMWNLSYAINIFFNRVAQKGVAEGKTKYMFYANVVCGQTVGFLLRFVPALIILLTISATGGTNIADYIPAWFTQGLSVFGGMIAALGMGILLSFLVKKKVHFAIFLIGFILISYFGNSITMLGVAVLGALIAYIYYYYLESKSDVGGAF
ncbi:MAG TPA: PTS sugar transporter subunit IIC [Haloplasmataceae bacterium]